ncbi:MAG: sigma 54-interacting transcriptional regulator [Myxococcales bacterium]|nr:sigma 54-interacting transcriptional regulator [Myxococcales bacterium]
MANQQLPTWLAEKPVAVGAAGEVSRARLADGRDVALKRYQDRAVGRREAALLRRLALRFGPRLVAVVDEPTSPLTVVLEWVDGAALGAHPPPLPVSDRERLAAIVAHGVGRALAELHELGIRHGDVKPANIVLHGDHVPTRDAADDRGATLIDLSLATGTSDALVGATPAYLAPEVLLDARWVGPETDLFAFGVVLRDLSGGVGEASLWAAALMAREPGARPRAAFVADRAAAWLGLRDDAEDRRAARVTAVRRAYLRVRERDLSRAASLSADVRGLPRTWLEEACGFASPPAGGDAKAAPLGPLDAVARARWLTALVGTPPDGGALEGLDEATLAERLVGLAQDDVPFALANLRRDATRATADTPVGTPVVAPAPDDAVALAVLLTQARPSRELLARAEGLAPRVAPSFRSVLVEALLRCSEVGRAFIAVGDDDAPEASALRAEIARRMGDAAAAERFAALAAGDSRARAVRARLAWDRGAYDEAERLAQDLGGVAAAEIRGLVAYARGEFAAGIARVNDALSLGAPREARARLFGVRGMLHHASGNAAAALESFRVAAEDAQAGGVVEEATYLTGLAAAASDAGQFAVALAAATRSALLFEELRRPSHAARAWLARASVLGLVGAAHEACAAADEVIERADARGDSEALAYARLVHAEARPAGDAAGRAAALGAWRAVAGDGEVRLRVAARVVAYAPEELSSEERAALDEASSDASLAARWEWWGGRASGTLASTDGDDQRRVATALLALLGTPAPLPSRAFALSFAPSLAAQLGDGDAARRFEAARRAAVAEARPNVPADYAARFEQAAWVRGVAGSNAAASAAAEFEPAQIMLLDGLVRSLSGRERLRPLFDQVLDALLSWTGVERGVLMALAPDGSLVPRAARNLARRDLVGDQRALSLGLARRALDQGDVVIATDAFASLGDLHASVHALRLRSVLAIPLLARGEALGVVYLDDRNRRGAFGPREVAWVRLVAAHAALAIADARDAVRLRRAVRHAERAKARLERELEARGLELDRAKAALGDEGPAIEYEGMAGRSDAMQRTLHLVARVSGSDVPVLIVGESGTGKELLARAIHASGPRRAKAFVTENCGALPEALLESTLFGHKRGAFTGATANRPGLFEVADGGTLFLDEVGEMSPGLQAKLLRVLQNGEIRAVGDERSRRVNVRVLAATHRDLEGMVKSGAFREDLYYRLNVVSIPVPPLRERPEDIPSLVTHLVLKHGGGRPIRLTRAALERLVADPWPGNVRQLENEVRRALVLAGDRIDASELSPELMRATQARRSGGTDLRSRLDSLETELVQEALDKTRGNQTKAAEMLGVSRFGLQKMIKRLGLRLPA